MDRQSNGKAPLPVALFTGRRYIRLMANSKPFVSAALVCEDFSEDADGIISVRRIVDTFAVVLKDVPADQTPVLEVKLLFGVKSGDVSGPGEFTVGLRIPGSEQSKPMPTKWAVTLNGDVHGANLKVSLGVPARHLGTYWADLYWNGEILTSAPFRLVEAPENPTEKSK